MKIEGKSGLFGVAVVTALALLQCLVLYAINPTIFGISLGLRLDIPGRGRLVHEAYTPKTRDLDSRTFFMREGEELDLTLDFELESGWLYVSFVRRFPDFEIVYSKVYQASIQDSLTITAPRTGFYRVGIDLHKFKGVVRAAWK